MTPFPHKTLPSLVAQRQCYPVSGVSLALQERFSCLTLKILKPVVFSLPPAHSSLPKK